MDVKLPVLPAPAETGVAIVGAGLTGLSAAYHIRRAEPRTRVDIFDAGALGDGASGRSGGIFLDETAAGPAPGFENCLGAAVELIRRERIECDLELNGCWEVSHTEAGVDSPLEWTDEGVPLRVSGLIAGGTVDPGRLVEGMAQAALHAGARIHEHCPVRRLEFDERPMLQTARGRVAARCVVLATNAYSPALSHIAEHGSPVFTLAVATAPLEEKAIWDLGMGSRRPFYTLDLPYLWARLTQRNELVLGSGIVSPKDGDVLNVSVDAREPAQLFKRLEARVRLMHPALANVPIAWRWGGPIAITRDWLPVLHAHPESSQVLFAGGYSGHGLAQALRMGELVAERLKA